MSKTILIVDDSAILRRTIKHYLKNYYEDMQTIEANNGQEAYFLLTRFDIDVVLLDLYMPVMDGFEFLKRVRQETRTLNLPVIVLTTAGKDEIKRRAIHLGANGYLTKPFQPTELKAVIEKFLQ